MTHPLTPPNAERVARRTELGRLVLALLITAVPLLLSQQVPAALTQPLGEPDLHNVTGLASPEQGEGGLFRWSLGPVSMRLQPLGWPLTVETAVQGVRPEDQPLAHLTVRAADATLADEDVPRSPATVTVQLPPAALLSVNPQVDFDSTMFQPAGDRRQLGLVYYRVTTRTGPGPNLPAPWPATALLLSGLLVYAALRAVTRRVGPAFVGVVGWGLLLGAVNAVNRPWLVFYSWYWVVPPLVVLLLVPWGRSIAARRAGRGPVPLLDAPDVPLTPAPNRDSSWPWSARRWSCWPGT